MTLLMERERKKRRINLNDYNDDNDSDNEDVKMEKFFALIRSAKDIRDQLLGIEPTREEKEEKRVASDSIEKDKLKAAAGVRRQQETTLVAEDCEKTDLIMLNSDTAGCSGRSGEDNHHHNKTTADHSSNNNVKVGNFLLDLNLSL